MTSNSRTIDADNSIAYASKVMREENVGVPPIVEGEIDDVASTRLVTIDSRQDLNETLRIMAKHQVRRLPAVEEGGRLVGVVAHAEIAREGGDSQTGQLVEEISK
jgi:CBS domain-containing protein